MCYSALVTQDLGKLDRKYGAKVAVAVFADVGGGYPLNCSL
ncbi:MAG TPA: hypothetical protein VJM31_18870 [Vicinamibacterales bacterium]|nr:hypothetical protein [Vicinamibacterales bacterium]